MATLMQRVFGPPVQRMAGSAWFGRVGPKVVPPLDRTLFKLTGGRLMLGQSLVPSLVLTTTGSKSGLPRPTPLACLPEDDGGWLVAGSNFGRPDHPAWSTNLLREPRAEVGYDGGTTPVRARLLEGADRERAWAALLRVWPVYDRYEETSGRELRVFRLTPTPPPGQAPTPPSSPAPPEHG